MFYDEIKNDKHKAIVEMNHKNNIPLHNSSLVLFASLLMPCWMFHPLATLSSLNNFCFRSLKASNFHLNVFFIFFFILLLQTVFCFKMEICIENLFLLFFEGGVPMVLCFMKVLFIVGFWRVFGTLCT